MDLVTPPKSPVLDRFPSFFLLAPCHLIQINNPIESCLTFAMLVWQSVFLHTKNLAENFRKLCAPGAGSI